MKHLCERYDPYEFLDLWLRWNGFTEEWDEDFQPVLDRYSRWDLAAQLCLPEMEATP